MFPGHLQADHQATIAGIATGNATQWHSLVWGYLAFPFIYFAPTYACYGLVQIGLFVLAATYSFMRIKRAGIVVAMAPLAVFFGLFPTFLLYNNLYCSDIVFCYAVMVLVAMAVEIVVKQGAPLKDKKFIIILTALVVLACSLRKNGLFILVGLPIVLLMSYPETRRNVCVSWVVSLVLFVSIDAMFPVALGAKPSPSQELASVPAHQIAYVYSKSGAVSDRADAVFSRTRSSSEWAQSYLAGNADPAKSGVALDTDFIAAWLETGVHNPVLFAQSYADIMYPYWQFGCTDNLSLSADFGDHDDFTFQMEEKYPGLSQDYLAQFGGKKSLFWLAPAGLYRIVNQSHIPVLVEICDFILFNRALPLWVMVTGLIVLVSRRRKCARDYAVVITPVACVMVSLLLFSPIAHMRYALEMYYALPLIVVFVVWRIRQGDKARI